MYHFFQNILKNAEERNIARTLPYTVPDYRHINKQEKSHETEVTDK